MGVGCSHRAFDGAIFGVLEGLPAPGDMRHWKGPRGQGSTFPSGATPMLPRTSPKLCDFVLKTTVSTFNLDKMQALSPLSKAVSVTRNSRIDNEGLMYFGLISQHSSSRHVYLCP